MNTGGIVNVWCRAAYDISPDGRYALSLNFSRLHRLRPGYGYGYLSDETTGDDSPEDDGVWSVDPEANDARLLFALGELAGIEPHASMIGADHYINHISISPDGGYFLFLHLWYNRQNRRRYSRLFVARENGSELKLLFNGGLVSHYTWLNNEECLVVTRIEGREDRYVRYHVRSGFNGIIGLQRLVWDGHPSLLRTGKLILDTYPDQERMQTLYTYDVVEGTLDEVARWRMPVEFTGEMRCDLHPHASASRNYLAVDMVRAGFRHVSVIAASDCLDKTKGWCEAKASLKGDR